MAERHAVFQRRPATPLPASNSMMTLRFPQPCCVISKPPPGLQPIGLAWATAPRSARTNPRPAAALPPDVQRQKLQRQRDLDRSEVTPVRGGDSPQPQMLGQCQERGID